MRKRSGAIAYAANRLDGRVVFVSAEFASEALDVNVDEIRARIEVVVPHVLTNLGSGKRLARCAQEIGEEGEFAGGQRDRRFSKAHFAGDEIHGEFAVLE